MHRPRRGTRGRLRAALSNPWSPASPTDISAPGDREWAARPTGRRPSPWQGRRGAERWAAWVTTIVGGRRREGAARHARCAEEPAADPGARARRRTSRRRCSCSTRAGCSCSTTTRPRCCSASRSPELGEIPSGEFGAVARSSRRPTASRSAPARLARRASRSSSAGPRTRRVMATDVRRRAPRVRGDRVSAVRRDRRDARRDLGVLGARRPRSTAADAGPRLGMPRLGRGAGRRHREVRRQHVVRRGAPRERSRARARRRHRHAAARRRDARTTARPSSTSCSRTCTSTTCRASGSSGRCSPRTSTSTSGDRRRRCSTSPSASRCTSRRRCSRCTSTTSRRTSRSTTRPRSRSTIGSATVRAAKVTHQGPTVGYRIEENGRTLVYLPDHEPSLGADLATRARVVDERARHRARRRRAAARRAVPRPRVRRARRLGPLEHRRRDGVRRTRPSVDQLVLFHHDPYHTDDELEELLAEARDKWPGWKSASASPTRA